MAFLAKKDPPTISLTVPLGTTLSLNVSMVDYHYAPISKWEKSIKLGPLRGLKNLIDTITA